MKHCFACDSNFESTSWACPSCGNDRTRIRDGVLELAPEMAQEGEGFRSEFYDDLHALEADNFWFKARSRLIIHSLQRHIQGAFKCLEIGCGTGFVLMGLKQHFKQATLMGSELFSAGLMYASKRMPDVAFMQMDARKIPFRNEFDVVGAFDVIEHIQDDVDVLAQIHAALKPGGLLLVTVPQHPWLWGASDDYACHVRRYTAHELRSKIEGAGFSTVYTTSFVALLLPLMALSRWLSRGQTKPYDPTSEYNIARWMKRLFDFAMDIEFGLIRMGIRWPFGGSRLLLARKPAGVLLKGQP